VDLKNVANVQNVSAAGEKYVTFDGIAKACAKVRKLFVILNSN
jgi:hypothetical protein